MDLSIAEAHEAIAATRPDDECLVFRDRRLTWSDVTERTRRFANHLIAHGLGCHRERDELADHESGQDHLGIYLHNGNEYLESMLGAFKARVAPFNVNYRYGPAELRYLLVDARATAIVVHSCFAPTLVAVLEDLPDLRVIVQVPDSSGTPLLPGAVWYEDALGDASPAKPAVAWSLDDLYLLYTGGTTGMPKGVMWRGCDAMVACFGAGTAHDPAATTGGVRALPSPPLMHGSGHWLAMRTWNMGGTVVLQSIPERLDPADVWKLVGREQVNFLLIVGDPFARPLVDELRRGQYDVDCLTVVLSGGAPLSTTMKDELASLLPTVLIVDGLGSSEAGGQLAQMSGLHWGASSFPPAKGNHVLSADLDRELSPGDLELGWLARSGRLALGYFGDRTKTAETYRVVGGTRYAVPGDRARIRADGSIDVLGRDAATINSGGEKIFAEEVEAAVKAHPDVYDCVVAGRPSRRWGHEVVAIVRLRAGRTPADDELRATAERSIARFKLPKAFVYVDDIVRSPTGKADYRWARRVAASA